MKKILLSTVALAALSTSAMANETLYFVGGFGGLGHHTTKMVGAYSFHTHQLTHKDKRYDIAFVPKNSSSANAFTGSLFWGWQHMLTEKWVAGTAISVGYDTANVHTGDFNVANVVNIGGADRLDGTLKQTYKPQWSVGFNYYVGTTIAGNVMSYFGLGGEFNFARVHHKGDLKVTPQGGAATTETYNNSKHAIIFSVTPFVGLGYAINEKWTTLAQVGYKFGLLTSMKTGGLNFEFKKKPQAFIAQIGLSYAY